MFKVKMKRHLNKYIFLLLLSFTAILIHGYQFGVSDQEIFIPYILKTADPSLFQNDILFTQPSANVSLFYSFFGFLIKYFNIELVFFIGYLVFQFLFFDGIYRLSRVIFNRNLAYFSLIPFLIPKFIGGTATFTYDPFFGYRSIGLIFLIYYITFLIRGAFYKATTGAILGMLFHPLSIIPNILILPATILAVSKNKIKDLVIIILVLSISIGLMLWIFTVKANFLSENFSDQEWFSIIRFRDDYLFPSLWSVKGWLSMGLYLTLIFLFRKYLKSKTKRIVSIFIGVALVISLTNYIVLEIFRIPLIAQFQLVRSSAPIAYIALAIAPLFLIYQNLLLKTLGVIAFGALSLNLFYVFLFATVLFILSLIFVEKQTRGTIPAKEIALIIGSIFILHLLLNFNSYKNFQQKIQFPKQTNDWIALQLWARNHTDKTATFLVPPDQTGFRIFSQRPIVGDIKDGAVVIYSPSYANYWRQLMDDLENYHTSDEEEFANLQKKYQNEYVVTLKEHNLNFLSVYKNDSFNVFKVD